jgi:HlyD family secretion protein
MRCAGVILAGLFLLPAWACGRGDEEGSLQGVVELQERDLSFEVAGRLTDIPVREGDALPAGALIARLDDRLAHSSLAMRESEAQAAADGLALLRAGARPEDVRALRARVASARAREALLERTAARTRRLQAADAVTGAALDETETELLRARAESEALGENLRALSRGARRQEIEEAEHRLAGAQAAVDLERERLARHQMRLDVPAVVLEVHLEPGELASPGAAVVTVADPRRPHADLFAPLTALPAIKVGAPISARVDGLDQPLAGKVERIARQTEFTPRYLFSERERGHLVVRVRVRFEDPQQRLRAGVPVFVKVAP